MVLGLLLGTLFLKAQSNPAPASSDNPLAALNLGDSSATPSLTGPVAKVGRHLIVLEDGRPKT